MGENIRRVGNDRMAGVGRLFFLAAAQVLEPARAAGGAARGDLELRTGSLWRELESTIYTAALDTAGEMTPEGLVYNHELTGFFEGDSPEVARLLAGMHGRRFAVILRDFNLVNRVVGADQVGLTFAYKFQSGKVPRERKGYSWSFKGVSLTPALFYAGAYSLLTDNGTAGNPPAAPTPGGQVQVFNHAGVLVRTVQAGQKLIITSPFRIALRVE